MTRLARTIALALAIALVAPLATRAHAQGNPQPAPAPKAPPAQPAAPDAQTQEQMQEMMKKALEAGTPGPMHELLRKRVGEWDMVWEFPNPMAPGGIERSTGSAVVKPIFGGRYISTTVTGTMMGQPFQGMDINGYNNTTRAFESLWIDSMGTSMLFMTGTYDEATRTFTMRGEMTDPMTGGKTKIRTVYTMPDDKPHTFKMFTDDATGEQLWMTVTYTRRTAATSPDAAPKPASPGAATSR